MAKCRDLKPGMRVRIKNRGVSPLYRRGVVESVENEFFVKVRILSTGLHAQVANDYVSTFACARISLFEEDGKTKLNQF